MQLDYNLLLDNVKRRRFDEAVRDHILSPSFLDESIPACIRYAYESMYEVDQGYTYKVYANTRKIEKSIVDELEAQGIRVDVRYQGPLRTETHIRLYGQVDMLFIMSDKASSKDVFNLGKIIRDLVATQDHQNIDYSSGLRIQLITQKPSCKINIYPAMWVNNPKYLERKNEIYRGVAVFNFKAKTRKKNLPFLNMARVRNKDNETGGNYKNVIRLLKSLTNDLSIDLDSSELSGLIFRMSDKHFVTEESKMLSVLPKVNDYIKGLLDDQKTFQNLLSPSDKELVFGNRPDRREAVAKLQAALNTMVSDIGQELGSDLSSPVEYISHAADHADSE